MEKEKYNSSRWIETIEKIVKQFHSTCSSLVSYYPEEFKKLPNTYKNILKEVKDEMGNGQQNGLINRHKIIAGYIKALMVLKIFTTKSIIGKNPKLKEKLPNECLCLGFLVVITHSWGRDKKKYIEGIKFKVPKKYGEDFAKMLYRYKNNPKEIDVLQLSHIVYLLELSFDCYNKLGEWEKTYSKNY